MNTIWPLSRTLLMEILADRISDNFVVELVWVRLGYKKNKNSLRLWLATEATPSYWSEKFPASPEVIAQRPASIHLTRSIPKQYKQALKEHLGFEGYKISELFPRRTRRATVVNWLIASFLEEGLSLPEYGPTPQLNEPPDNPLQGHLGDVLVE